MRKEELIKTNILTCDYCGKSSNNKEEQREWVSFNFLDVGGIRLFEKISKSPRYETFNLSSKKEKNYCSINCARSATLISLDIFFKELKSSSIK
jgi:ribosomal protein S26